MSNNCLCVRYILTEKESSKRLLTAEEVSTLLHIPKSTLYKLCNDGEIPAARIGKHWRFDRGRVDQWLLEQFDAQQVGEVQKEGIQLDDALDKDQADSDPTKRNRIK